MVGHAARRVGRPGIAGAADGTGYGSAPAMESSPPAGPPADRADDIPQPDTKRGSELNREDAERIAARVRQLFEVERVFLDPDLSLHALAGKAKTTRHKLSAALRQIFGATFYQLIAGYRVRDAARVLQTKAGAVRTIADIAFASGFNTLSAFNAAFRAEFGVTPSVFRDQAQNNKTPGDKEATGR
jgi:AraC-like DNA-binding protein